MIEVPRESNEFVPVHVTVNGQPVTDGVEVATTTDRQRPEAWAPAVPLGTEVGLFIGDLLPGTYDVWVRVLSNPERPVDQAGRIRIT